MFCDGLLLLVNIYPVRFCILTYLFNFILGEFTIRSNEELVFDFAATLKAFAALDFVGAIVHFSVKAIVSVVGANRNG